ncbi:MAG: PD-(D/E)XK nuclease family protein, partial [Cellvibrionaceae bacterium]|nr:PD-(D/E)XK nuclease family protein [Cellvibrionaceae bacterium]
AYEQLRPPGNSSLLAKIWPTIKREAQVYSPAEASGSTQATGPHPSRDFGLRLADNWRAASLNNGELLAAFRGREFGDADNNPEPFRSENTFHRHLGTVMHRALRQICIDGQGQWPAERRLAQTELWQQQLQQLGLWPDGARQGATLIEKAMALCLQDPIGRWLLNNQHDDSQCEWRLWHSQQGREYILDRSFIYRGQRWVIDYKSALPAAEQSEAEFIEQQWDSYGEQLANYQRLLSQLGPEPVQTALYFPLIQTLAPGPGSEMPSL